MSGIERNASFGETVDVLREWALAIRRDWGAIDGRSCKAQLDQLAALDDLADPTDTDEPREG